MIKVAYKNLGCKVNNYELDIIKKNISNFNIEEVLFNDIADIYIINTCTVTSIADKKSRQMIHQAKKNNKKSIVIAVGCFVDNLKIIDENIDICIKNSQKNNIINILKQYLIDNNLYNILDDFTKNNVNHKQNIEKRIRQFVKIQDGCNQYCSYCIIPYVRNKLVSKSKIEIINEVNDFSLNNIKEVVITGIHLSSYSLDFYNLNYENENSKNIVSKNLLDVIDEVSKINNILRIRLGSLEPRIITEDFIKGLNRIDNNYKFCPSFHLSLQSGSDKILKKMNRHYTTNEYKNSISIIRNYFEEATISTDVIVGFPGETDDDFEQSLNFLKENKLYNPHIFQYSDRVGTVSYKYQDKISSDLKHKRSNILIEETKIVSDNIRNQYVGRFVEILIEKIEQNDNNIYAVGFTKNYIKTYIKINCFDWDLIGKIIKVKIEKSDKVLYAKYD